MRNLGDMNDLYNTQDIILLCEIGFSKFTMIMGLIPESAILPAR